MGKQYEPGDFGYKAVMLPLVDKSRIRTLICELDGVFQHSVAKRPEFDGLIDKIATRAIVVVACLDGRDVGYCAFYMNDFISRMAYITLIAVRKEYQNMRIGTDLIQYVKQTARVNGIRGIRLEVEKENIDGIRFYERNHFTVEGKASSQSVYMVCVIEKNSS